MTAKLAEAEAEAAAAKDAIETMRGATKANVEELCDQLQQLLRRMEQCVVDIDIGRTRISEAKVMQQRAKVQGPVASEAVT